MPPLCETLETVAALTEPLISPDPLADGTVPNAVIVVVTSPSATPRFVSWVSLRLVAIITATSTTTKHAASASQRSAVF